MVRGVAGSVRERHSKAKVTGKERGPSLPEVESGWRWV